MNGTANRSTLSITLPASLTLDEARKVMGRLGDEIRRLGTDSPANSRVDCVVDASSLEHFDSSALAILIECHRIAARRPGGGGLRIESAPQALKELARLYGLTELAGLSR